LPNQFHKLRRVRIGPDAPKGTRRIKNAAVAPPIQ
jgi:hypothetical protein